MSRRNVLRGAAAGAGAVTLPALHAAGARTRRIHQRWRAQGLDGHPPRRAGGASK
ncbi:twin-arginine translocation signal domain-containing protein [Streptomyces sp. NPDC055239]